MDIRNICIGCMCEIKNRSQATFCPSCGYDFRNMKSLPHQLQPYTVLKEKYLIGKVLGQGGFGITYIAYDLTLEMPVAIKEFYPDGYVSRETNVTRNISINEGSNTEEIEKWKDNFVKEARNLAKFANQNGIVKIQDFIYENETAYIVMEYVDGITVKNYLAKNGRGIPVQQVLGMMEPVIHSLIKMHEQGVIHRDISPDNIMINSMGCMKLLDFGAVWDVSKMSENGKSVMLKPGYAPEEQYRSMGEQGTWSDVYAVCATIYRCITGVKPIESVERIRNDNLAKPSALGVDIPSYLEDVLLSGMAVKAEERIRSMQELYSALYESNNASAEIPKTVAGVANTIPLTTAPVTMSPATQAMQVSNESAQHSGKKTGFKALIMIISAVLLIGIFSAVAIFIINPGSIDGLLTKVSDDDEEDDDDDDKEDEDDEEIEESEEATQTEEEGLEEEQLAKLDELSQKASQDSSIENLKDVLEQYYAMSEENKLPENVIEDITNVFENYHKSTLEHVEMLEQQQKYPAMYIQMKLELDDAIQLSKKYSDSGIEIDYKALENKMTSLASKYKQELIKGFDETALGQIGTNGVISRSALWPLMEKANETGLYDDADLDDPLRLRYMVALTYHVDSELDNLSNDQAINKIYSMLESTDYSPLLIYYLSKYGDTNGKIWYRQVNSILQNHGYSFETLDESGKKNFVFYYANYTQARQEIREYMRENFRDRQ